MNSFWNRDGFKRPRAHNNTNDIQIDDASYQQYVNYIIPPETPRTIVKILSRNSESEEKKVFETITNTSMESILKKKQPNLFSTDNQQSEISNISNNMSNHESFNITKNGGCVSKVKELLSRRINPR